MGARHGTQSRDSRIAPWAKGRCQTAELPRRPFFKIFISSKFSIKGTCSFFFFLRFIYLFIHDTHREAETQAEGEAGSLHREPDVGFDPGSPGSHPGPKAGAKPLCHPGIPQDFMRECTNMCEMSSMRLGV